MADLFERLKGGDLRSTGAADTIAREAATRPELARQLLAGLSAEDAVVRMRCADALEKVTRKRPEYLRGHARQLLALLDSDQPKEVLWHALQMCSRVAWQRSPLTRVFEEVERCLAENQCAAES